MLVFRQLTLDFGADAETRRVGRQALRKTSLEILELAKQAIVFRIRQRRTVENVVLVGCAIEDDAQLRGATKLWLAGFLRRL